MRLCFSIKPKTVFLMPKLNSKQSNYFKRLLRETYRLNKAILLENNEKKYAFMFFYQTKDRLSYEEIELKTKQLFQKFIDLQK